ncbi:MAG: SDR family oxidoreductase [Cyclobacteriaceae bacterium]
MNGKKCIVTGGNAGIGYETALAIAREGADLIVVSRNPEKGKAAVEKIKQETGNQQVEMQQIDMSSQQSIRAGAEAIRKKWDRLDVLVNNAGTWFSKRVLTEDGIETQFAVNHLAYFLFTRQLLPLLRKATEARVINVASDSHFQGKMHFDDLSLEKKYHGLKAYAQSKLGNVLFTYEFDRRKPDENISIYAVQPGLVKTDIGLKHTLSLHGLVWKIRRMGGVSPAEGAATSIFLASSPEAANQSGMYWDKCKPKSSSKRSYNEEDAARLWKISCELCGIQDYFA